MAAAEKIVADDVDALETPDAPEHEPTVRDAINAARAEIAERDAKTAGDTPEPQSTDKPARAKDDKGRFTSTSIKEVHAAARAGAEDQPADPAAAQAAAAKAADAPKYWNAEEKAKWGALPPEAKAVVNAAIERREAEVHRKMTEYDEVRNIGNEFMTVATEYAPLIKARNSTPTALFREFLGILNNIHSAAPAQKEALFRQIAMQNGVILGGQPPNAGGNQAPTPQQVQLPPEVQDTVRWARETRERQERETREREAAEMQQTTAEIEAFRSKSESKYFDKVSPLMTTLLKDGHAHTLEEAYNLAVRAHPETSKELAAAETAAAAAASKAAEDARRKAEAARRKSGSVRSGPGGAIPAAARSGGTVRDDLNAALEEVRGRI